MTITTHLRIAALALLAATSIVACDMASQSPTSPSAAVGGGGAINADGSTMKVTSPNAVFPLADATNVPVEAILTAQPAQARYLVSSLSHRFQVSDTDTFANLLSNGMGATDSQGLVRYNTESLPAAKKVFWRARAESNDKTGPWSNVLAFTTIGAAPPTTTPTTPAPGQRPADPPAGVRLPLPGNLQAVSQQFSNASESCPRGLKYINNPWQDRVIDAMRQLDTRVGYNGKPTRTASDNSGVPVVAAGDEFAYHYSAGPDQGSTEVHLVDMLEGHCGATPRLTWRVFTGEEPGRWSGAGRF